jgi:hypothetical protein
VGGHRAGPGVSGLLTRPGIAAVVLCWRTSGRRRCRAGCARDGRRSRGGRPGWRGGRVAPALEPVLNLVTGDDAAGDEPLD